MSKLVLGKGLGALIPTADQTATTATDSAYRLVPIDSVSPNPMQPRTDFDPERLAELVASIQKDGLLQPLIVRAAGNGYTIVAGERRFRAARLAGLTELPVLLTEVGTDVRLLELALVENIQRENLNAIELALAYQRLITDCGLTQQELSGRVGKSRAAIANCLRLLSLPADIQDMVRHGRLTEGHARALLVLPNPDAMRQMATRIVSGELSVRHVERETSQSRKRKLIPKRKLPALAEMETTLKQILGTAVRIHPGLKRGRIEIEYYGDDDLSRLFDLFRRCSAG